MFGRTGPARVSGGCARGAACAVLAVHGADDRAAMARARRVGRGCTVTFAQFLVLHPGVQVAIVLALMLAGYLLFRVVMYCLSQL